MANKQSLRLRLKQSVHFMGVGGSGMSGVALIAYSQGYKVSGCDLASDTPYIDKLKKLKIPIFTGHSPEHLKGVDILAATPAVFYQSANHPEVLLAKREKIIMTWQEFLGKYLHAGKRVVCVSGTHGKSTTTAMIGLLLEKLGFDPNVIVGATLKEWGESYRVGKGDVFVTEADEFYDNFLNYHPEIIVLNNVEFDHPDYFKDEKQLMESFRKHVESLHGVKVLIFNQDSAGIKKLFDLVGKKKLSSLNLYGYTTKDNPLIKTEMSFKADDIVLGKDHTSFKVGSEVFKLKIPGLYNVSNSLGVIALGEVFKIEKEKIREILWSYNGIGRRLELIGSSKNIKVYDDYAHHPSAIKVTLEALRQKYPENKILAVVEPHTFSRTKALLSLYEGVFSSADQVIIAPIFRSRDSGDFGVSGESIVKVAKHPAIKYIDSFDKIVTSVKESAQSGDIIIVMGAGKSYELARNILGSL